MNNDINDKVDGVEMIDGSVEVLSDNERYDNIFNLAWEMNNYDKQVELIDAEMQIITDDFYRAGLIVLKVFFSDSEHAESCCSNLYALLSQEWSAEIDAEKKKEDKKSEKYFDTMIAVKITNINDELNRIVMKKHQENPHDLTYSLMLAIVYYHGGSFTETVMNNEGMSNSTLSSSGNSQSREQETQKKFHKLINAIINQNPTGYKAYYLRSLYYTKNEEYKLAYKDSLIVKEMDSNDVIDTKFYDEVNITFKLTNEIDDNENRARKGEISKDIEIYRVALTYIKLGLPNRALNKILSNTEKFDYSNLVNIIQKIYDTERMRMDTGDIYSRMIFFNLDSFDSLFDKEVTPKAYEKASTFSKVIKENELINKDNETYLYVKAICSFVEMEYKLAIECLDNLIADNHENSNYYEIRALCYFRLDMNEEALKDFQTNLALKDSFFSAFSVQYFIDILGKNVSSFDEIYEKYLVAEPKNSNMIYQSQAQAYLRDDNYEGIRTLINRIKNYIANLDKIDTEFLETLIITLEFYATWHEYKKSSSTDFSKMELHIARYIKKKSYWNHIYKDINFSPSLADFTEIFTNFICDDQCTFEHIYRSFRILFRGNITNLQQIRFEKYFRDMQLFWDSDKLELKEEYSFYRVFGEYKYYKTSFEDKLQNEKSIEMLELKIAAIRYVVSEIDMANIEGNKFLMWLNNSVVIEYKKRLDKIRDELKKSQEEKAKIVQQYTHSLANTLLPNTIYEVAQTLNKSDNYKKEALILKDAYKAETFMKKQGQMLHLRNLDSAKTFQSYIRSDRLDFNSVDGVSIKSVFENAVERVFARFLNSNYAKLDTIRKEQCTKHEQKIKQWQEDFQRNFFFKEDVNIIDWVNSSFDKINIIQSSLWSSLRFKPENYAVSLFQGYFGELLFNALKYREQSSENWVDVEFLEKEIEEVEYCVIKMSNKSTKQSEQSISTGVGLTSIQNDIRMLNGLEGEDVTLKTYRKDGIFYVELLFAKDLIVPTPVQKISFNNLKKREV